jgi:hypothetical protein
MRNNSIEIDPKERECEGLYWIRRAEDREQWRVLVSTVTKLGAS